MEHADGERVKAEEVLDKEHYDNEAVDAENLHEEHDNLAVDVSTSCFKGLFEAAGIAQSVELKAVRA